MSDPHHKQTLSEISHLFLSGVRDRAAGAAGMPRPVRTPPASQQQQHQPPPPPPPKMDVSIDMTPEEFAGAFDGAPDGGDASSTIGPVSALIVPHLGGDRITEAAKSYARHLAFVNSERVGVIEVDASLLRLYSVERNLGSDEGDARPEISESLGAHQLAEAIEEMNWDVDRWLVVIPDPRVLEAKALLRQAAGHWVLLTECSHEGMVAAYRTLKGLADAGRPRLSLAILDADRAEADRISRKLSGVCAQFLNWPVDGHTTITDDRGATAHLVLAWRPTHDKALVAAGPQWKVVGDFLGRAKANVVAAEEPHVVLTDAEEAFVSARPEPAPAHVAAPVAAPVAAKEEPPAVLHKIVPDTAPAMAHAALPSSDTSEVIDLPDGDLANLLGAVLKHANGELVECPVRPPQCPDARLAITRDRRVLLLAVARQGLSDLRAIGQAYRWLTENRALVAMALPQFAIDPLRHPSLRLMVNHADLSADLLQPLLQASSVEVRSYRTLRWGAKSGLLLEAA